MTAATRLRRLRPGGEGFLGKLFAPMVLGSILNPINSSMIAVALVPIGVAFGVLPSATAWLVSARRQRAAAAHVRPQLARLRRVLRLPLRLHQWMEAGRRLSAAQAGLVLLPTFATGIVVAAITGRHAEIRGKAPPGSARPPACCGPSATSARSSPRRPTACSSGTARSPPACAIRPCSCSARRYSSWS
jgi:hypothetical protein